MMKRIDVDKLLGFMGLRMAALKSEIDRDKGAGLSDSLAKWHETKYWKEYIERGEVDKVYGLYEVQWIDSGEFLSEGFDYFQDAFNFYQKLMKEFEIVKLVEVLEVNREED